MVATYETPASLVESGADAARLILDPARWPDPAKRPTAIVAQSDLLAAGVVLAAREMGLRVPEDVAVVGFDDVEEGLFSTPSLTSIRPDKDWLARTAFDRLLRRLNGEDLQPEFLPIPFDLTVRETAPAPGTQGRVPELAEARAD